MTAPEIVTFGCRLNISESEAMQRHAAAAGLRDAVIINTCAVTAEAERQAGQAIRRLRREKPSAKIIVTGCASHIDPRKYADLAEVDHVIANDAKLRFESFTKLAGNDVNEPEILPPADVTQGLQRAFVQVQNGCNHRCTFCIIPYGRGASRSLTLAEIVAQMRARVGEGFNEIVLTGVDIASYGRDLPGMPTLGSMIAQALAQVPELQRLRLSSLDPAAIDEDLWRLIAEQPRLMPHLHLSLQAGDDMVLKRMKRRHSRDDIFALCEQARRLRPDIVFGSDIIAGFPTESDAMFRNTYDLVESCGLTWLHVFPYSSRKGTPASRMPQIHGSLRKERAERLRQLGDKAVERHHRSLIGQKIAVLVEKSGIGCTPHFAKVKLTGAAPVGHIIDVNCTGIENNMVMAEIAGTI
jgi:threonylcarbamoyladenosine tRNA methylthiotransferase MtaB